MKLKVVKASNIKGKRVLVRVDFNVFVKNGKVQDDFKIKRALPLIEFLLKNKCQVVLMSHLGRPKGKRVASMSLLPVFNHLRKMLPSKKLTWEFCPQPVNTDLKKVVKSSGADIIMLENLRFGREDLNCKRFARSLASLGDVYVNEAFAFSHRKTSSMVVITEYLPSYAGFSLVEEVEQLEKILKPKKPAIAILGGAKVETKLPVIKNLLRNYQAVLTGGAVANTFLKAKGVKIGKSLYDQKMEKQACSLLKKQVKLPVDLVVLGKKKRTALVNDCQKNELIVDVGSRTVKEYIKEIKKAKTVIWNGPVGLVEDKRFRAGTVKLAKAIAQSKAHSVAGGGETLYALDLAKVNNGITFISAGGGAMLQFLAGEDLPGLKVFK